jgi:uncharacterized protein (TIGR02145 family)
VAPNPSTNPLGFTALPGSYRDYNTFGGGAYAPLGEFAAFWSYTQSSPGGLYYMTLYGGNLGGGGEITDFYGPPKFGFSVRLVKNY